MRLSFSNNKKRELFSPKQKNVQQSIVGRSFNNITAESNLNDPFLYEMSSEEEFTDFDPVKKPNN